MKRTATGRLKKEAAEGGEEREGRVLGRSEEREVVEEARMLLV